MNDPITIAYVGGNIEATLSWARGLASARTAIRNSAPRTFARRDAKANKAWAWVRLEAWAKKSGAGEHGITFGGRGFRDVTI